MSPYLEPRKLTHKHVCNKPTPLHLKEGTRWQCGDCGNIYCLEWIRDRGVLELYWSIEELPARSTELTGY